MGTKFIPNTTSRFGQKEAFSEVSLAEYLPLITAIVNGETLQTLDAVSGKWFDLEWVSFCDPAANYRVKKHLIKETGSGAAWINPHTRLISFNKARDCYIEGILEYTFTEKSDEA